jgi:phosphoribosylformimino-5-aminoimidazole carboxamide ribonucleotide (ProFAR) isomerase
MDIIPAIDLLNGKSVLIAQASPEDAGNGDDPLLAARWFRAEGAGRLHVTDLNGVLEGVPRHMEVVRRIMEETGLPVQIAGGFRRLARIEEALRLGIDRVILGQGAIESPALLEDACQRHGERIALAVEIDGDQVVGREWSTVSIHLWRDVLQHADASGLERLIVTHVGHGATGEDEPLSWLHEIRKVWPKPLIVAGGISSLDQLRIIAALGALAPEAVVVGKALHERRFALAEAQRSGVARAE